jgi:hypothetical protein
MTLAEVTSHIPLINVAGDKDGDDTDSEKREKRFY